MKYLCLVYAEEKIANALPLPERQLEVNECLACVDRLHDGGHLIAAEALQSVTTATTVRLRNGKVTTTDGPFAETKEQLAGFYLLEARDLDQAMQLAGKIPPARHGSIEIRPLRDLNAQ